MGDTLLTERTDSPALIWIGTLLGSLALILAVMGAIQAYANRELQEQAAATQTKLAKAQTFANLDNSLIQLLAKTAADTHDAELRDLLAKNGITFQARPSGPSGP